MKSLFYWDEQLMESSNILKSSVENFNTTLSRVHVQIGIKSYGILKG